MPDPYLQAQRPWALDLNLEVWLNGERISATSFRDMYWTFAQQLAHMTVNGATTAPGDLFGSGTVSGPTKAERGSLIELTWRGAEPLTLAGRIDQDASSSTATPSSSGVVRGRWSGPAPDRTRPRPAEPFFPPRPVEVVPLAAVTGSPLWRPDRARAEATHLARFLHHVGQPDYAELHQWSLARPEALLDRGLGPLRGDR